jgi:[acyl-carrier-protein] S-malonyltransferase
MKASIIFPAFVSEYSGAEEQLLAAFENNFFSMIEKASDFLKLDLTGFDFQKNNFLEDELKSQYISYLFSCSVADILKTKRINSSFVSGYSMGIYAALYYCGSVSFNDGLAMVKAAWDTISTAAGDGRFGMGMIIGLEESDLLKLMPGDADVEICNQNNKHTFIISGSLEGVQNILTSALTEGAMKANAIAVSKPYHSKFLKSTAPAFTRLIRKISFQPPERKYISSIDQRSIETPDDLKAEIIRNLSCRMNWLKTMNFLTDQGTEVFFECGAGDGLTRNSRFIEGDFKSFSVAKIDRFLEAATG